MTLDLFASSRARYFTDSFSSIFLLILTPNLWPRHAASPGYCNTQQKQARITPGVLCYYLLLEKEIENEARLPIEIWAVLQHKG